MCAEKVMEGIYTILYIEDDTNNRTLVRRILISEGLNVMEAANATNAMELLRSVKPDLILMDINMPDIDGYTLTTSLKHDPRLSDIPIIALTANVMRGDRERSLEAGCDGYIQKPIDVDSLGHQIYKFLGKSA